MVSTTFQPHLCPSCPCHHPATNGGHVVLQTLFTCPHSSAFSWVLLSHRSSLPSPSTWQCLPNLFGLPKNVTPFLPLPPPPMDALPPKKCSYHSAYRQSMWLWMMSLVTLSFSATGLRLICLRVLNTVPALIIVHSQLVFPLPASSFFFLVKGRGLWRR